MDDEKAITALSALAQEHRLKVFRLLVKEAPGDLTAGELADRVGIAPSALSFHLAHLVRADIVKSRRHKRNIFYGVHIEGMRRLITFITEDCCHGHPEICGGVGALTEVCD